MRKCVMRVGTSFFIAIVSFRRDKRWSAKLHVMERLGTVRWLWLDLDGFGGVAIADSLHKVVVLREWVPDLGRFSIFSTS